MSRATHFQTSKKPRYRNDNGAYFISVVEQRGGKSKHFERDFFFTNTVELMYDTSPASNVNELTYRLQNGIQFTF
jgi:hypothetical protein